MSPVGRPDTIGVLGGMGPLATADLLTKVVHATPAGGDQDHLPLIVANLPHIPDRQLAVRGKGPSPLPALIAVRDLLLSAGARCLVMPCNSAHVWYPELTDGCPVPFLHIVDAARDAIGDVSTVGVVAAPATLKSRLYPTRLEAAGLACTEPTSIEEAKLEAVIAKVKAGYLTHAAPGLEAAVLAQLNRGADTVILACTELPLLLPHLSPSTAARCVDATDALAKACVKWGMEQR
jgi:aspartate racemase